MAFYRCLFCIITAGPYFEKRFVLRHIMPNTCPDLPNNLIPEVTDSMTNLTTKEVIQVKYLGNPKKGGIFAKPIYGARIILLRTYLQAIPMNAADSDNPKVNPQHHSFLSAYFCLYSQLLTFQLELHC